MRFDVSATSSTLSLAFTQAMPRADAAKPESRQSNRGVSESEAPRAASREQLSEDEQKQVDQLRKRDQEVRTHEQAHVAAAGALFRGGPYYTYQAGPDGKRYAVGGSVKIDTSEGSTPEETIRKASQIRAAALAPAEPSSTDQAVAARASRMEAAARQELALEETEDADADSASSSPPVDTTAAANDTEPRSDANAPAGDDVDRQPEPGVIAYDASGQVMERRGEASFAVGASVDTFG
ncbi:MAG: putative metalloprotease CJM1_0395 family protein [Planctomycetota bacterium]